MIEPKVPPMMSRPAANVSTVRDLLDAYEGTLRQAADLEAEADRVSGGLLRQVARLRQDAEALKQGPLRQAVEREGNYEKDERGRKAVLEERKAIAYDPRIIREVLPQYARDLIVVTETVDKRRLEGLLVAGLVHPETVEPALVVTVTKALVVRIP